MKGPFLLFRKFPDHRAPGHRHRGASLGPGSRLVDRLGAFTSVTRVGTRDAPGRVGFVDLCDVNKSRSFLLPREEVTKTGRTVLEVPVETTLRRCERPVPVYCLDVRPSTGPVLYGGGSGATSGAVFWRQRRRAFT